MRRCIMWHIREEPFFREEPFYRWTHSHEIEVLRLIAIGKSTKEIAHEPGITFKTAACHRSTLISSQVGVAKHCRVDFSRRGSD